MNNTLNEQLNSVAALAAAVGSIWFPLLLIAAALAVLNIAHLRHSAAKQAQTELGLKQTISDAVSPMDERIARIERILSERAGINFNK